MIAKNLEKVNYGSKLDKTGVDQVQGDSIRIPSQSKPDTLCLWVKTSLLRLRFDTLRLNGLAKDNDNFL